MVQYTHNWQALNSYKTKAHYCVSAGYLGRSVSWRDSCQCKYVCASISSYSIFTVTFEIICITCSFIFLSSFCNLLTCQKSRWPSCTGRWRACCSVWVWDRRCLLRSLQGQPHPPAASGKAERLRGTRPWDQASSCLRNSPAAWGEADKADSIKKVCFSKGQLNHVSLLIICLKFDAVLTLILTVIENRRHQVLLWSKRNLQAQHVLIIKTPCGVSDH